MSSESVDEALYLCDYYLRNAIPMINIIKEGGAWSNERRILKHLLASDNYTDSHSSIMNNLHIKAKPLADCIRNLEEQEFVEAFGRISMDGDGYPRCIGCCRPRWTRGQAFFEHSIAI
ncbi:MAG: hypothetical protein LRZ88_06760 [Candidatus Cloacimonetes bacterium]|nr:hypothetical protein [Candidatus Cloacimonadota bacterium]